MAADLRARLAAMHDGFGPGPIGYRVAPLGVRGDLVKRPEVRPAIVARLRRAAPLAEKAKVVIGLETALDAAGNVRLLDEVGATAVRVYFPHCFAAVHGT